MANPGPEARVFQLAEAPAYAVGLKLSQDVYRALQSAAEQGKQLSLQISSPGCPAGASEAVLAIGEEQHVFTAPSDQETKFMDLLQLPDAHHQAEVLASIQQKLQQQKRELDAGTSGRVRAAREEADRKKQEGAAVRLESQQNVKSRMVPRVTKTVQRQVTPPPSMAATPAPVLPSYPPSRTPPPAASASALALQKPAQPSPASAAAGAAAAPARKVLQPPKPGSIKSSSGGAARPGSTAGGAGTRAPQGSASPQAEPALPAAAATGNGIAAVASAGPASGAGASNGSAAALEVPPSAIAAARQGDLQLVLVALLANHQHGLRDAPLNNLIDAAYKAAKRPLEAKQYVKRMLDNNTERVYPNRIKLKPEVAEENMPRLQDLLKAVASSTGSSGRDRSGSALHRSGATGSGPPAAPSPNDDGSLASGQPSPARLTPPQHTAAVTPPQQPAGATPPRQPAGLTPPRQSEAPAGKAATPVGEAGKPQASKKRKLPGASPVGVGQHSSGASQAAKKAKPTAQAGNTVKPAGSQAVDRAPAKEKAGAAVVKPAPAKPADAAAAQPSLRGISSWDDDDDDSDDGALAHLPRKPHSISAPAPPPPQYKPAPAMQHPSPRTTVQDHQDHDWSRLDDMGAWGVDSEDEEGQIPVRPRSTAPILPAGVVLAPPPPPIGMALGGPPAAAAAGLGTSASPRSRPVHLQHSPKAGHDTAMAAASHRTDTNVKPKVSTSSDVGPSLSRPSPGHAAGKRPAASPAGHMAAVKRSPLASHGGVGGPTPTLQQPSAKRSPAASEEAAAPAVKRRLQQPSVSPAHAPRPSPLPSPAGGSAAPAPAPPRAPSPAPANTRPPPISKPSPVISKPSPPSATATPAGHSPEPHSTRQQPEQSVSGQAGSGRNTPLPAGAATPPVEEGVYANVKIMEDSASEAAEYAPFAAGTVPFPQLASPAGSQALANLEAQYKAHHTLYQKVKKRYSAVQAQLRALHDAAAAAAAAGDSIAAEELTRHLWKTGASRSCQLHTWQRALHGLATWLEAAKRLALAATAAQQHSPAGTQTLTEEEEGLRAAGTSTGSGSLALAAA